MFLSDGGSRDVCPPDSSSPRVVWLPWSTYCIQSFLISSHAPKCHQTNLSKTQIRLLISSLNPSPDLPLQRRQSTAHLTLRSWPWTCLQVSLIYCTLQNASWPRPCILQQGVLSHPGTVLLLPGVASLPDNSPSSFKSRSHASSSKKLLKLSPHIFPWTLFSVAHHGIIILAC